MALIKTTSARKFAVWISAELDKLDWTSSPERIAREKRGNGTARSTIKYEQDRIYYQILLTIQRGGVEADIRVRDFAGDSYAPRQAGHEWRANAYLRADLPTIERHTIFDEKKTEAEHGRYALKCVRQKNIARRVCVCCKIWDESSARGLTAAHDKTKGHLAAVAAEAQRAVMRQFKRQAGARLNGDVVAELMSYL